MKQRNNSIRRDERGAAIIYVFIGIILFAALAFTFTRSANNSVSSSSSATNQPRAIQIMSYGDQLAKTVNGLLIEGCSLKQINFKTDRYTRAAGSANPNAPVDGSCDVFYPGKGGVRWRNCDPDLCSDPYLYDPLFPDSTGVTGLGSRPEDLIFMQLVSPGVCDEINKRLGLPVDEISDTSIDGGYYTGTFDYDNQLPRVGAGNYQAFEKTNSGCLRMRNYISAWGGDYRVYYHVLVVL